MASEAELLWWDKFADVMARQWNLTPGMNRAIRSEYERDYEQFLYTPGGTPLDVECGTGVRTQALAGTSTSTSLWSLRADPRWAWLVQANKGITSLPTMGFLLEWSNGGALMFFRLAPSMARSVSPA
jgi:hypothetical protein